MTDQQTSPQKQSDPADFPPRKVVCVGTVVLRGDKVLFIRQAASQSLAGRWSIPWGYIEADEAPEAAALRETLEESGVTAPVEGFLGFQNLNPPGMFGMVFLCRHESGELQADGVETDEACYLDLDELDGLGDAVLTWCAWLARKVLTGDYSLVKEALDTPDAPKRAYL